MNALPIVEQVIVHSAGVTLTQTTDDGRRIHELHLDVIVGQAAKRYTIRFDDNGWHTFRDLVTADASGIQIARAVPDANGDPPIDVYLGR